GPRGRPAGLVILARGGEARNGLPASDQEGKTQALAEDPPGRGEALDGRLERSVGVLKKSTRRRGFRIRVEGPLQRRDSARADVGVGVQEEQVRPGALAGPAVTGRAESPIPGFPKDASRR